MRFSSAQFYVGVVVAAATAALAAPAHGRLTRRANCTPTDNDGSALTGSSVDADSSFVTCSYKDAGECTYFFADGAFSSGSSTCPQGLPQDLASSSNSISTGINCAAVDDDGSPLTASSVEADDSFVTYSYRDAGDCTYSFKDGKFSSGSSTCPRGLPENALSSSSSISTGINCVAVDEAGSPVTASSVEADDSFVTCSYRDAGDCTYSFKDGKFSSGSSTCPLGLPQNAVSSSSSISPNINCATVDDDGSLLTASSADAAHKFVTCEYQKAGNCTYFFADGAFSSGVSTCPPGQLQTGGATTTLSTLAEAKTSAATAPAPAPTPTTTNTTSTPLPPPTTTSSTEPTSRSGHLSSRNAAIIIGTVVGAVVLLLSIVLSVVIIKRRRARGWRNLEAEPFSMDHEKSPSRVAAADAPTPLQVSQSGPNESRVSSSNRETARNEPGSGLAEQLWGLESRFRRIEALVSGLRRASGRSGRSSGMSVRSAPPAYSDAASVS
ncbi:hypothetical protein FB451DRAFT_1401528 [Mycena latifolia]|nr:hypothetical protein FB451DRAFT_1401528 [Mycena latifolia]